MVDMDKPFAQFAEDHLKGRECTTCGLILPRKESECLNLSCRKLLRENARVDILKSDLQKYKAFYHASVEEHRKSIELIDSLENQTEVLRPVYEAAKLMFAALEFGTSANYANARDVLSRAVNDAAMDLEDNNE